MSYFTDEESWSLVSKIFQDEVTRNWEQKQKVAVLSGDFVITTCIA